MTTPWRVEPTSLHAKHCFNNQMLDLRSNIEFDVPCEDASLSQEETPGISKQHEPPFSGNQTAPMHGNSQIIQLIPSTPEFTLDDHFLDRKSMWGPGSGDNWRIRIPDARSGGKMTRSTVFHCTNRKISTGTELERRITACFYEYSLGAVPRVMAWGSVSCGIWYALLNQQSRTNLSCPRCRFTKQDKLWL